FSRREGALRRRRPDRGAHGAGSVRRPPRAERVPPGGRSDAGAAGAAAWRRRRRQAPAGTAGGVAPRRGDGVERTLLPGPRGGAPGTVRARARAVAAVLAG